ncbi:hypothetical protein [Chamaesiphon sp.]|uniref:hypothetical protein n=1 Tax=Chamaesiphon sp. TaxID=2814140 RepID=UPI0035935601
MTQKRDGFASVEADESYEIPGFKLSIEVNFTSGDLSNLDCYQALGVSEVWFWEDGILEVYSLPSLELDMKRRKIHESIGAATAVLRNIGDT